MKTPHIFRIGSLVVVTALIASQSVKAETYTIFNNPGTFAWDVAPWSAGSPSGSNIGLMQGGGTVTVNGSTPAWTTDALLVGWGGNANLAISSGNLTVGDFSSLGLSVGESGIAVVNQTGGLVTAAAVRFNRGGGTGTYNLDGGTLAAGYVNKAGVAEATLNLNGGTLQATAGGANWFGDGGITVMVKSGGAIIDTQAFDVGFTNNLFDGGGGGGLTKNGTGTLALNNVASLYTGATTINAGKLVFSSGTSTGSISVSSNATVAFNDSAAFRYLTMTISGAGNVEFQGNQSGFYSLNTGALTNAGTTTVNLTSGGSEGFHGTLFVESTNRLSANSVLNVLSGKVDLRADQTIAGLTGSGGYITTDGGSAATLTVNTATGQTHTYSGVVGATLDAYNSPNVAITKTGSGTQVFSGANSYTGGTTVSSGTLLVSNTTGSGLGSGTVTVNGGTLGGSGSFTGEVTLNAGGTLAPGSSIESLGAGGITLAGGTFAFELNTTTTTADLLFASDATVALTLTPGVPTLTLTDLGGNVALADGTKFTLISYTAAGGWNNGIFSGYANGSSFTLGANTWQINYADLSAGSNFNSDAVLFGDRFVTITVVPEPSTWLLLACGLTFVTVMRRRRSE